MKQANQFVQTKSGQISEHRVNGQSRSSVKIARQSEVQASVNRTMKKYDSMLHKLSK